MVKSIKSIYHFIKFTFLNFFKAIFICLPVNNDKVVLQNFLGKGYGDNPKYLADEILLSKKKKKLVWLISKPDVTMPKEIKQVKIWSISAMYHLSTAKIWIDNVRNGMRAYKKRNQVYIQIWHGGIPLKHIEKSAEKHLSRAYVKTAKKDGRLADYMFSNSKFTTDLYNREFWFKGKVLELGVPKDDGLFQNPQEIKSKVITKLGLTETKDINFILYAPTFRKAASFENFSFNYEHVVELVENQFNKKYIFLIRFHPNDVGLYKYIKNSDKIINVSEYPDMQELLVVSDFLITDYSSTMFEFSLLDKVTILFAKDLNNYLQSERGMYFNYRDLPFPIATCEEELYTIISSLNINSVIQNVRAFIDWMDFKYRDDHSSKRIIDFIMR